MSPIRFGIVGAGWRAEFYVRIAKAAPDRFELPCVVVRNAEKRAAFARRWDCPVRAELAELLEQDAPQFVVTSVPWAANPNLVRALVERGVAVLSETPPAPDLAGLVELYEFVTEHGGKVCVAEQYVRQPYFAAVLATISKGLLGTVTQAQISAAHGYHGISLIRQCLGVRFENAAISAKQFAAPLVRGPGRDGPPSTEAVATSTQRFFWLDFGEKLGFMDFTGDQYFSWVRGNRVLVRSDRGEISNDAVAYLQDFLTPIYLEFVRHEAGPKGNLEGNYLKGIQLGADMVYRNPLAPAALSDDEIAIGDLLLQMADYANGGDAPYPLAEACQDHYLSLMCDQALSTGNDVVTECQPWAS